MIAKLPNPPAAAKPPKPLDEATRSRIRAFLNGEITWAQVEGMTAEKAAQIAKLGCELADRGRLNDSRVLFEGLVAVNPKDAAAHAALGGVYQKLGRREDARACFDQALAIAPHNPVALANRGELRLKGGDSGGIKDLTDAVQADKANATAAGRRARFLLQYLERKGNEQPTR